MSCQLFVRWNKNKDGQPDEGTDTVELIQNEVKTQSHSFHHNRDRVYGYCLGIVETLTRIGVDIRLPLCLQGHLCANTRIEH